MKTIEEIIREIEGSEELRKEYEAIKDTAGLEAILKKLGCEATADEFIKHLDDNAEAEGAVSDNDAEAVAGGWTVYKHRPAGPPTSKKLI